MSMEFVRPAAPKKHPLYFVNRYVDWGVIGGVSVVMFLFLYSLSRSGEGATFGVDGSRQYWAITAAFYLQWVINWPHFSATNFRLYHSPANIRQYPFTAYVVPVLVLAATWASFALPTTVAPYFILLFFIWSPYHFSGQSVGITMIYARRSGFQVGKLERLAISGFIFGTYVFTTSRYQVNTGEAQYFGVALPTLGIPAWFPQYVEYGMYACGALLLVLAVRWSLLNRRILAPIVLLPAATQFVWFVLGPTIPNFYEFVPMFHSLQYMLIAWSMQLKERVDEYSIVPTKKFAFLESSRWFLINIAGGAVLFYYLPKLAAAAGAPPLFGEAVILSAIQIHHFFVDGVIWKLKNPKVSSPLLVNIPDLIRNQPEPVRVTA